MTDKPMTGNREYWPHVHGTQSKCARCDLDEIRDALDAERKAHTETIADRDYLIAPNRIDEQEAASDPVAAWRQYHLMKARAEKAEEKLDSERITLANKNKEFNIVWDEATKYQDRAEKAEERVQELEKENYSLNLWVGSRM
jgi:hypothetical protein